MVRNARHGEQGFTLLEVLAAFIIAAAAIAVLLQAGFTAAAENRAAAVTQQLLARAQSRLASVGTLTALAPMNVSGDDGGGYRFALTIAQVGAGGALTLYDVSLTESFGPRRLTLATSRLGPSPGIHE
jgi:general secretion pathway protein I